MTKVMFWIFYMFLFWGSFYLIVWQTEVFFYILVAIVLFVCSCGFGNSLYRDVFLPFIEKRKNK